MLEDYLKELFKGLELGHATMITGEGKSEPNLSSVASFNCIKGWGGVDLTLELAKTVSSPQYKISDK